MGTSHTFSVVYLLGVAPSALASVHSRVTMHRTPFFFAMVTGCLGVLSTRASFAKVQVKRDPRKLLDKFMAPAEALQQSKGPSSVCRGFSRERWGVCSLCCRSSGQQPDSVNAVDTLCHLSCTIQFQK